MPPQPTREMKTKCVAVFLAVAFSALADDAPHAYPSGFTVALQRGSDLYDALPAKFGDQLAAQPVALQPLDIPQITPITSVEENKVLRQVSISAGFIDLVNHLSHARAVDHVQPGFFDQYVQNLGRVAGEDFNVPCPSIVDARFWTDDVMNDQASYFNQMAGLLMAINFSHHYLGHYAKYSPRMAGAGNKTMPINGLLTPAEWEVSVKAGATDALNCALATEGAKALFEAIDKLPARPAWTEAFVPRSVDLQKLNKELSRYETDFYHGGLKFSLRDKLQFLPAWEQSTLERLAQKALDGRPALLAVIQRPMIDIHADELVRQFPAHVPGVLQGVGNGLGPVIQAELDAAGQDAGNN
jgi:hypothetical protein